MKSCRTVLMCSGLLLSVPALASAQGYIAAFVGGNFGGDTGVSLDQSIGDTSRLCLGGRAGVLGGGIFGAEFDVGYTPDFYGKGTVFDSSSVTSIMGNLVLGIPAGPVRPYAVAGLGLIRRTIDYAQGQPRVTDSRVAYDVGGGLSVYFGGHVGINFDLRFFRNFTAGNVLMDMENDKFHFARGTVGLALKF